ncbi:MAG: LexA family transcriptional regulator [Lachnospiraceae bacterium]|nr:LexA family transcriptional regulator [Lachnospiraceae bacterium]
MTQKGLSEVLDVSVVTVRNWELGNKSPSMSAIVAIADTFRVSTDYLLGVEYGMASFQGGISLSPKELSLIEEYRSLDAYGKKAVEMICAVEKQRSDDSYGIRRVASRQKPNRYIPKYATPSAAGASTTLDGDEFEMIIADEHVPSAADFAVRIQGNSMLPYIRDGETVFVRQTTDLSNGDIGIFCVDGAAYCKQYYRDEEGNLTLVSANPEFGSTNVRISSESESDVRCYGKVLVDSPTPLPGYFLEHIKMEDYA